MKASIQVSSHRGGWIPYASAKFHLQHSVQGQSTIMVWLLTENAIFYFIVLPFYLWWTWNLICAHFRGFKKLLWKAFALGKIVLKNAPLYKVSFFPMQLCSKIPFSIFTATILHVGDFLIPKADACTTFPKAPCPRDFPAEKIKWRDTFSKKKKSCQHMAS